jgi:hypothetical protein
MRMVSEYFKSDQFIFPNEDTTYMEVAELTKMVNENAKSPNKIFEKQDEDLKTYLTVQTKKLGLKNKESIELVDYVVNTVAPLVMDLKQYWNRARPYQYAYYFDMEFHPFNTISSHSPSYPSGHSLEVMCWKKEVDKINPSWSKKTEDVENTVNQSRMSLGVHFPSDISFAREICNYIHDNNLMS